MTSSQRPPGPASPDGSPVRRRWGTARAVLAVLGGVAVLLCLGGLGIGYLLYDEATAPDRSAPDVAADNYLRALLVERNDAQASQLECDDAQSLQAIYAFRSEIDAQEKRLDTTVTVSWGELRADKADDEAVTITTSIRRTASVDGTTQSVVDEWRFRVEKDGDWRVCAAEQVT